jgi:hypothetical protein
MWTPRRSWFAAMMALLGSLLLLLSSCVPPIQSVPLKDKSGCEQTCKVRKRHHMANVAHLLGTPSHTLTGDLSISVGTDADINDDDTSTYISAGCGGYNATGTATYLIDLPYAVNLKSISFKFACGAGGPPPGPGASWSIQLYYSGSWHVIDSGTGNVAVTTKSYSTGWTGVTAAKLYGIIATGYPGGGSVVCYEIDLQGSGDSKIHVGHGGAVVKIAKYEDATTSPLRAYTQDGIIHIPLVATSDAEATPIRIRHNGVTYALKRGY